MSLIKGLFIVGIILLILSLVFAILTYTKKDTSDYQTYGIVAGVLFFGMICSFGYMGYLKNTDKSLNEFGYAK